LYTDEAIAGLPEADPGEWRLGRLNPAFRRGPFERHIFESLFRNLSAMLKNWAHEEEEAISAYVIKQIDISPDRLSSIASALTSIHQACELVGITVIKYWYDPAWKVTSLPCVGAHQKARFFGRAPSWIRGRRVRSRCLARLYSSTHSLG
jgi:hypothetical protein